MRKPAPTHRLSLRAFALRRRVQLSAVQRAIADGRLTKASVGHDAKRRPFIKDPDLAVAEWEAHTRPRVSANGHGGPPSGGTAATPSALAQSTQREREARAKIYEHDLARRTGQVIPIREVEASWSRQVIAVRTHILGLPTRAKQRLPHLSSLDLVELDKLVREALEELGPENNDTPRGDAE